MIQHDNHPKNYHSGASWENGWGRLAASKRKPLASSTLTHGDKSLKTRYIDKPVDKM